MTQTVITNTLDIIKVIQTLPDDVELYASTFNISTWMPRGPATIILDELSRRKANLLVGVPFFRSCIKDDRCTHCEKDHYRTLERLARLRDHYKNIKWNFAKNVHAKMMVAKPYVITGGRNITDSKIEDLSFVSKSDELSDTLIGYWNEQASDTYDIGAKAPLVFTPPYRGELMADSSHIPEKYKEEVKNIYGNIDVVTYWDKQ